ncbi:MAG: iron-sulfur cluster assembly protein [Rikenellaceae bacterium]|nr:iron-sulfur cluster assembly protein [Rikenellaceae bacterium]
MATPQEILAIEKDIVNVLKNIYDPEIPVNIYDLGLIYEVDVQPGGQTDITMTLTAPTCPVAEQLVEDIRQQVGKVKGVAEVNVNLVFDPPWDRSMISEEALLELGLL